MNKLFVCAGAPASAVNSLAMLTLRNLLPEDNACPGSPDLATGSLAAISSRTAFPHTSALPSCCPERPLDALDPLADPNYAGRCWASASNSSISFNSFRVCSTNAAARMSSPRQKKEWLPKTLTAIAPPPSRATRSLPRHTSAHGLTPSLPRGAPARWSPQQQIALS